jgi:nucleotide-binding universal stress UspA family protein
MNRCLIVATDGSPAAQSALCYALDFAPVLRIQEIVCLCVDEENGSLEEPAALAVGESDMALRSTSAGVMLLDQPDVKAMLSADPAAVLDACLRDVTAAGFRFAPVSSAGIPSDIIVHTGHVAEAVFLGRNSDLTPDTQRLGSTVSNVLQRIRQTAVICPAKHTRIERLVLALVGGQGDPELVARGATIARALKLPVHVAVCGNSKAPSTQAVRAAQTVLANAGLVASGECYACRPDEYVETLQPVDLLVVARSRRWRLVQLWFGSSAGRIVERAPGPVAVIA